MIFFLGSTKCHRKLEKNNNYEKDNMKQSVKSKWATNIFDHPNFNQ